MKTIILARDVMKKCETTGCTNLGYQIHSPDPDTAVWLCVRWRKNQKLPESVFVGGKEQAPGSNWGLFLCPG